MNLLFFLIFSSAVYNYGIGLQFKKYTLKEYLISFAQVFVELFFSLTLSWFLIQKALVPIGLPKLFPLIAFLSFYISHSLIHFFLDLIKIDASTELFVPVLILIISIFHSLSYTMALIISFSCLISYFFSIPLFYAIEIRINKAQVQPVFRTGALILISLAVIMLSLYAFDLSWLFKGDF